MQHNQMRLDQTTNLRQPAGIELRYSPQNRRWCGGQFMLSYKAKSRFARVEIENKLVKHASGSAS